MNHTIIYYIIIHYYILYFTKPITDYYTHINNNIKYDINIK